ncbi:MAG TPA: hypothetical protein DEH78_11315, partial [Solibacterales bacterium]|nr:hypothetical protein [Bryobacterales bacterium]
MTKRILLVLTGLVLAAASTAQAQTAQITGRVLDPSDSPVAGGRVTVQNLDTGIKQALKSNAEGYYTAPLLTRGTYQVTAEASGFKTSKSAALPLDEGQVLRLDLRLQIGAVTESVDVVATAGSLSTEATSISTVVSNQRVVDLPLAGRNPLALANLVPGVRPVGEFGALTVSAFDGARASISGGAPSTNNYMIDGVAAENFASGGIQITLSPDATEEFRVITRNASAEYGRTGGGIINITSKAGTNRWQGSIFEFLRNRQLNANNFFANAAGRTRAPFIFNQYGATLGGPLKKDKTFFFFNWEAVKQRQQSTTFRTVPTDLQKSGNFSQTLNAAGAVIAIYDPLTTAADPARPGRSIRTPFPGNVIPSGRINAVSRAMAAYYPTPNQAGAPNTNANNFFGQASAPVNKDVYGIRIDHYLTPSRRIFGRYTYDLSFRGAANFFGNEAEINTSDLEFRRNSAVFNYTDAVTPTFLIDGRLGFNRYFTPRITRSFGFDLSRINMPAGLNSQIQIQQLPRFAPGDVSDIGAPADDQLIQANESYTAAVAGTWLKSAHNVRFGFEHRQYRANNNQASGQIMFFGFGRGFTQGPDPFVASAVSGFGFATFLLGSPGSGEANRSPAITYLIPNYALFVQDDWKLTPRLTINMGLRWEVEGPYYDRFNAISNFDPSLQFRAGSQTLTGGLVYPGTGGLSRGSRDVSYRDFMPRLGVSYQLRPKTVVRAAYGIFYLPTTGINTRLGQTGFSIQTPYIASIDGGLTPAGSLSNPFPNGITMPPGSAGGPRTGLGTTVNGSLRSLKRGYSQQWNMNLQQELPGNWIVELGYMGNRGVNLPAIRDYRYLPAAA